MLAAALCAGAAGAEPDAGGRARALHERESGLAQRLAHNEFNAPLVVESEAAAGHASGDVYARVPHPFATLTKELARRPAWCEVLMLHPNVKGCEVDADRLLVHLGRKVDQPLAQAYRLAFSEFGVDATAEYLGVHLAAPNGPMDTSDYRIDFEAVPAGDAQSFVHLRYALATGPLGRFMLQAYLLTLGSGKVGFSAAEPGAAASAPRVGGERGVVERNAMRYYLAVVAYLDSLALPPGQRRSSRLAAWFDATERHRLQLHEIERDDYLRMKADELSRQATSAH